MRDWTVFEMSWSETPVLAILIRKNDDNLGKLFDLTGNMVRLWGIIPSRTMPNCSGSSGYPVKTMKNSRDKILSFGPNDLSIFISFISISR
jgi:hypothetical protein